MAPCSRTTTRPIRSKSRRPKSTDLEPLINELATVVDIAPKDRKRFRKLLEEGHDFASLPIRTRLNDEEVARFAANKYRFPGVDIRARLFRHYPNGEIASHVIGYIGRLTEGDLDKLRRQRRSPPTTPARTSSARSDSRGATRTNCTAPPASRKSRPTPTAARCARCAAPCRCRATICCCRSMPDCRKWPSARSAIVAARWWRIEPSTGGVLALVSKPGFDPNLFVDGIDPQNWDALNNSPDHPLNNRALQGVYPPGSTFKPFMALAALELGKRNPHHAIFDPGYFVLGGAGGHRYRDWKTGGHGMVDLHKSIVISCDTYYYGVAQDLGIDNIHQFIGQFGFGKRTGIDIDGEAGGLLPSQEWKMQALPAEVVRRRHHLGRHRPGLQSGHAAAARAGVAILANNGTIFRPHIVRQIQDSQTNALTSIDVGAGRHHPAARRRI